MNLSFGFAGSLLSPPTCSLPRHSIVVICTAKNFVRSGDKALRTPYEDFLIRSWQPGDRHGAAAVIRDCLTEHKLPWDPQGSDNDAVNVENVYVHRAEFWVVQSARTEAIVGTGAFRPLAGSASTVEIRKMYLAPYVRGRGLGNFLLHALEERARQFDYRTAYVETVTSLEKAAELYSRAGYAPVDRIETPRCDLAFEKTLVSTDANYLTGNSLAEEHVVVVDADGCNVAVVPRSKARKRRLLYRAIAVLVLSRDGTQAFAQRRSRRKHNFPGVLDMFVAGAVRPAESLIDAAHRELAEELGLDGSHFDWSQLWNGPHVVDRDNGDRCTFFGFVAQAKDNIDDSDVHFHDGEVEEGRFMTRQEVDASDIPSPLWEHVLSLELEGQLPNRNFVF